LQTYFLNVIFLLTLACRRCWPKFRLVVVIDSSHYVTRALGEDLSDVINMMKIAKCDEK